MTEVVDRESGKEETSGGKDLQQERQREEKPRFMIEKLEEREIPDDVALHSPDNQI